MIVVDSNIIFSMLLKNNSLFNVLENGEKFIIPKFLFVEIFKYKEKISKYSKLDEEEIFEVLYEILKNVTIVDDELISNESYKIAYDLVKDIDEKDIVFVALCIEFDALLWTGDKKLIKGLKAKKFLNFYKEEL